jgi:hypothetical protein
MANASVSRRHREAAVIIVDGEMSGCGLVFVEQDPKHCTCEGRGYKHLHVYPRAAQKFADMEMEARRGGREAERRAIVAHASKLNYGPTLRTFIKHVVREYHLMPGASDG